MDAQSLLALWGVTAKVNGEKLKHNLLNSKTKDCDSKSPKTHIVEKQSNIPRKHRCLPGVFLNSFPRKEILKTSRCGRGTFDLTQCRRSWALFCSVKRKWPVDLNLNTCDGGGEDWTVSAGLISPLFSQTIHFYWNANDDLATMLPGLLQQ